MSVVRGRELDTELTQRKQVIVALGDTAYRQAFVEEEISTGLAFQIRAMRTAREWSQQELGRRAGGIAQETVCKCENPGYGRLSLTTLKRLAAAFDVALVVRFVPFSTLVDWSLNLSPLDVTVPSFADDKQLASDPGSRR